MAWVGKILILSKLHTYIIMTTVYFGKYVRNSQICTIVSVWNVKYLPKMAILFASNKINHLRVYSNAASR